MGNPYPQCTSGMTYDASTIPGGVATFTTCCNDWSPARFGQQRGDANTVPGTRHRTSTLDSPSFRRVLDQFEDHAHIEPRPFVATKGRMTQRDLRLCPQ